MRTNVTPDGKWMWNGQQWVPTVTPDGKWVWNGQQWVATALPPVQRGQPNRKPLLVVGLVVLGLIVLATGLGIWAAVRSPSYAPGLTADSQGACAMVDKAVNTRSGTYRDRVNALGEAAGTTQQQPLSDDIRHLQAAWLAFALLGGNDPNGPGSDQVAAWARQVRTDCYGHP